MDQVRSLTNAYSQAPWRKQVQIIVAFLLVVVFAALVASIYLYVSSQAVEAGVATQRLHYQISAAKLKIEDYESQLAELTSEKTMAERADQMGYKPVDREHMLYLQVPGYTARQAGVMMAPQPQITATTPVMTPAYTESLLDWFTKNILAPSGWFSEVTP